ncbi:proton-coupled amino acid transporter-like protein pathetic [Culicoides brevitarsis]|uniref:proton-coupled amino acid transporter-like protein pathetic n=1 Tax=Culicoides brevitarsis TaxID=469753 RepID=UPI00307B242B
MVADVKTGEKSGGVSTTNLTDYNSTTKLAEKDLESYDEYNPFEHRETEKPNSTMGSLAHLLKSSLGTGILAMPAAFKNAGLLFGALGTIIVGLICTHCVHILVKTSHNVCKKTKVPVLGFAETAERVFEYGPLPCRRFSKAAKEFIDYALMATYYSAGCVYILFIAESTKLATDLILDISWDVRIYIAIIIIPVLLIGQFRSLKYLVPFSMLANIFIVIVFGITLYYMFNEPLVFSDKPLMTSKIATLPLFFSTVIFAMEGIGAVMPVENEMAKPQHFLGCPGVLNTAMFTVIILYASLGFLGYVRFGDEVKGSVTLNLPADDLLSQIAQYLIATAILFTFGLQFYIPMDILMKKIKDKLPKNNRGLIEVSLRTVIMLLMACVAVAVPDLEPFISLVGAIFFSTLGLLVPSIVETVFHWDDLGRFNWILCKNIILGVFSILALIAGSAVSINNIINIYSGDKENHTE